jgi:ribosomal protein L7/L12
MNNAIALKALEILARDYDVNLSQFLADFANSHDSATTNAVLEAVSKATEQITKTTTEFRGFHFTTTHMDKMREAVIAGGKIPAIKICREISRFGLKDAKECVEKLFAPELEDKYGAHRQERLRKVEQRQEQREYDTLDNFDWRLTEDHSVILCPDGVHRMFKEFDFDGNPIVYGNSDVDNPVEEKTFCAPDCQWVG